MKTHWMFRGLAASLMVAGVVHAETAPPRYGSRFATAVARSQEFGKDSADTFTEDDEASTDAPVERVAPPIAAAEEQPKEVPAAPTEEMPEGVPDEYYGPGFDHAEGIESGCDGEGCGDPCALECEQVEPWRLFGGHCPPDQRRFRIHGWVNGGFTANFDNPISNFNGPVTFNDRDEGQLNQLYLIGERPLDSACGWDIGGRVDLLYGTDYRFVLARGLDAEDDFTASWNSGRFYGLAMPQAYGEVGYNSLALKLGHFYTVLGYEVAPAAENFFYSHAYAFAYGQPITHSGVLGTWKPNEQLSIAGGVTTGWDNFEDVYNDASFLGAITFTASDGNSRLALAMHTGDEEQSFGTVIPTDERSVYSIVYGLSLTDRLSYVLQHDNGRQENAFGSGESAEWYGLNQYLFYKLNCCWSLGTRLEWFRDDDGFRVAPAGDYPALGTSSNVASAGGFEGDFWALTVGANWKPTANLTVRPEMRYDWYDGRANELGNEPFDDGGKDDQWLAAFDVIYLY